MNSVMFAALCTRHSMRDITGSHFRPTRFQIQLTPSRSTTSVFTHTTSPRTQTLIECSPTPTLHASRSILEHCMSIPNLITLELSGGGPVLPNHICTELPKADKSRLDSITP
ncbi:hypothetical protein AMECASPLE_009962 [Ameca splendens]|uniref:Uncharacterized protein n=1 Tax=Ameca splendens TaxID=208324 RepID=A0ABV0ZK42_9TELE